MASSEKKISEALAHAFNTAQRYSHAILLLCHFEVFKKVSSQEGPPDQVGLASEVASIIREFTQPDSDIEFSSSGAQCMNDALRRMGHRVLLVAAADSSEGVPAHIRRCFSHEISVGSLNEDQRADMLSQLLQTASEVLKDNGMMDFVKDIVGQTSGFMPRDIRALVADVGANIMSELKADEDSSVKCIGEETTFKPAVQHLGKEDITRALERSKKRNASALGTPKVPNVKWEDVGGLEDVKKAILDTVQGNYDDAISCYNEVLRIDPLTVDVLVNRGNTFKEIGRVSEAIQDYIWVVNVRPTMAKAHANLASAYKDSGHVEAVIKSYRQALLLRPEFPEATCNLLHTLQTMQDWTTGVGF